MALARAIPPVSAGRWLVRRALDWEDWLTFALVYFTFLTVAWNVQRAQWVEQMPSLVLVGLAGLLAGMLLARSSLPLFLAWPLGVLFGLAATFVQTLALVDGDGLRARVDAIHFRFERYFDIVSAGGIANDSLPFVVLVVALTWLAAFFWAWSLFRWHHPWLGLVPGAITLFINYIFLEQQVLVSFALYAVGALLLVSRTNLTKRLREWQAQEVTYSPFLSLSAVHLSAWAALVLLIVAWLPPATPARPLVGLWEGAAPPFQGLAEQFVRLAGPLRVSRVVPVHDYTSLFPLQGSVDLREDDLLTVRFTRSSRSGPLLLRGAVYDEYTPGGWKAAPRVEIELPQGLSATVRPRDIVRVEVEVVGKSVVGSVIFTPGHPLGTDVAARARVPASGLTNRYAVEPAATLPDIAVVVPARPLSEGESYTVAGLIRDVPPAALRRASADEGLYPSKARYGRYPYWISELYLRLPSDLPGRVHALAFDLTSAHDNGYDKAIAVQRYLRSFPVDYEIDRAPPGQDAVDYFLFDARRGYFDYHASAMVVLLRAAGVPARLAVGFVVDADSFDAESGSYTISERDAYAWPEVYFPDYGWIEFNPTPDRPPVLRPGAASAPLPPTNPDLSAIPNLPVGSDVLIDFGALGGPSATGAAESGGGAGVPWAVWVAVGLAAVVVAAALSARLGWERSVAGLPYSQQVWEKTVRLASWAGLQPQAGETAHEFGRRLGRRFRWVPGPEHLAAVYNRSRYGRGEADEDERGRLKHTWQHLRGALLAEVVRKLWRR